MRQEFPQQKIVVLADSDDRTAILECLAAGANGYVLKSTTMSQFLRALEIVLSGGVFAPAALAGGAARAASGRGDRDQPAAGASDGSADGSVPAAVRGLRDQDDRAADGPGGGTVKVHLAAIYRVLGAHSRIEALAKARGGITMSALERASQMLAA